MKKILFICDPLHLFKIKTDTTYLFLTTASELGYGVYYCLPGDLFSHNHQVFANVQKITINTGSRDTTITKELWYEDNGLSVCELSNFAAVMVRNDPPFNMEYYYLTQLLSLAEINGCKVINSGQCLRNINEKLAILNFPNLITPTLVSRNKKAIFEFIDKHQECVIKPLDLMGGRSVFKLSPSDANTATIVETITNFYTTTVMTQKFIPEVRFGDKRIFIINGKVVDMCLYRIPAENQIRGNLAAGGRGVVKPLDSEDFTLANEVAQWLQDEKVVFAGIDVIGNKLTEINITSPTGARQLYEAANINVAKLILEAI